MSQLQYSIFVALTWTTVESLPLTAYVNTYAIAGHEVYRNYFKVLEVNLLSWHSLGAVYVNQKPHWSFYVRGSVRYKILSITVQ